MAGYAAELLNEEQIDSALSPTIVLGSVKSVPPFRVLAPTYWNSAETQLHKADLQEVRYLTPQAYWRESSRLVQGRGTSMNANSSGIFSRLHSPHVRARGRQVSRWSIGR